MAYNAVAQLDHEVASNSSASASRSPSPAGHAFEQLPLDTDHIGGGSHLQPAKTADSFGLESMIRSMTSNSYDMVEDDDYDADHRRSDSLRRVPPLNTAVARQYSPLESPLPSAHSEASVPLSHPIPDLQSIQGAYIGNVERLEQSAEQLSSCSADIGSEIRRLDQEQKQRSCSSAANSVVLRNGAFSPTGTISSAHGSNVSPARLRSVSGASHLAQVPEPTHHEHHEIDEFPGHPALPPPQPPFNPQSDYYYDQYVPQGIPAEAELERRASVASVDTFQQARTLFNDFDGVHFTPLERGVSGRQVPLDRPPLARNQESYKEPRMGEDMVYYPAPVPRMLNLPPKLSRRTNIDRDQRRTQIAGAIAAEDRKPAVPAEQQSPSSSQNEKRKSTVPPHLRASVFFEQPSSSLHVQMKQNSAVATLESILDASANAPVSAFTDHPYAGHLASQANKSKHKSSNSRATLGQPTSASDEVENDDAVTVHHQSEAGPGNQHDRDHDHGHESGSTGSETDEQSSETHDEDEEELDYVSPPNTLLAELELRKHELKHRRRTAVPVPFQGMQTTLLQMDEKAQQQSDKRRLRPIALAWESRDDDEDVPLGMLYQNQGAPHPEDRPLGLMEKRQQEENEPLSSRRARLRGEPIPQPQPQPRPTTIDMGRPPDSAPDPAADSGDEIETMAERLQRLKGHTRSESVFASELMAEIDTRAGIVPTITQTAPEINEEETLAQRRSRLQKEAATTLEPPKPRVRRSMAALTQGRPSHLAHQPSHDFLAQRPVTMSQYGHRMSMQHFPSNAGYPMATGYPMGQQYGYPVMHPSGYPNNPAMMGMSMGHNPNMARQSVAQLEPDVIDRWRQSIR
ncbi:hypothetical protein N7452_002210 [Penicillium brevicompactum]|uniref:Uncharacterized protein n=1 Tax=Penicillium brevicompactum TaxID=5074 RepID=A0A9W9R3W6_PENBR|nr:hypothetical protein N7452_002210 [Penicillium brevicompactum]